MSEYENDQIMQEGMKHQHFANDVFPSHGDEPKHPNQYRVPWRNRITEEVLIERGFHILYDLSLPHGGRTCYPTYKRTDPMGRTVYIELRNKGAGGYTVTHAYANHNIWSVFQLTEQYVHAILAGQDNDVLFYEFPKEKANG